MSFLKNRERFGKIRVGQVWKKRDIGQIMTIISKQGNDSWRVVFIGRKNASHKIKQTVIYNYYEKIE